MFPLPGRSKDPIKLADWVELCALVAPDRDASKGDLESALRTAGLFPPRTERGTESEEIEKLALSVFDELEARSVAARPAYPFRVEGPVVEASEKWKDYPAYVFCLCLSYFGCKQEKGSKAFPRRWFEHISLDAAIHYLNGDGMRFASPRLASEVPAEFEEAIERVCRELGEGGGYKHGGLPDRKDDAVDVVAWKHFPDRLPGKLIMLGNCASERDWEGSKRTELDPEAFCGDWMLDPPCPKTIIRSFFIPHRVERDRLASHARRAGVLFDRCRIAHWSYFAGSVAEQTKAGRFFSYADVVDWVEEQLFSRVRQ